MVPSLGGRRWEEEAAHGTDTAALPSMLSSLSPIWSPSILLPLFSSLQVFRAPPCMCSQTPHSPEPGTSLALPNHKLPLSPCSHPNPSLSAWKLK